jgi:predicted dithiol-disulfide oxidoreductase (DUF899 family)
LRPAACRRASRPHPSAPASCRDTDAIGFTTNLLDLTALGRQEDWQEPNGRADGSLAEHRYHDEYGS